MTQPISPDDRVKTKVVGYREPHYQGEPKSRREIHELIEPLTLREELRAKDDLTEQGETK